MHDSHEFGKREGDLSSPLPFKSNMARQLTQIIESHNNSIPLPWPFHGMRGGRMTSYVSVPTKKNSFNREFFTFF